MAYKLNNSVSQIIKTEAGKLGFDLCGIAKVRPLSEYAEVLGEWCKTGMNGEMGYLDRDKEKRLNPELLCRGARSVIVTGLNYYTDKKQGYDNVPVISRYAYGDNYHDVITGKLNTLLSFIKDNLPGSDGKCFVDSAPLLEKAWAHEAGLGWAGRHSVVINDKIGSFFFIGVILLDMDLDYDKPFAEDKCGTCRICIDCCPTAAINENRTIDARKCIAYNTIESKNDIPQQVAARMEGRVFGCDRCQEVCPWNSNAKQHHTPEFNINEEIIKLSAGDWFSLSREQFNTLFSRSAVKRGKYERLTRNIRAAFNHNYPVQ